MSLNIRDKQKVVFEINQASKNALSAIIADTCGINVNNITKLRKLCRETGVYMRVARNTLLRRAVLNTEFECLKNSFIGPTLIAYSVNHPGAAARLFTEFAKMNPNFKIKLGAFKGKLIQEPQINFLATLPTYKEAILRLIIIIKEVSLEKLLRTLSAIRDKKMCIRKN